MPADTKTVSQRTTRQEVYDALTREDNYAQGWTLGGTRKTDAYVSAKTQRPFSSMEWIVFAEKYLNEAKLAFANYLPDDNVVNSRLLKAASLLVSALTVAAWPEDLQFVAGVSSTKFPFNTRGLKDLTEKVGS